MFATAWRCSGDGVGQSLTLTFAAPMRVSALGIVPGLAKVDPADGTDRYTQNRRITAVRLTTDDGRSVTAALDPSADRRELQWTALSATVTGRLTITVLDSVPGTAQNGQAANDTIAISEVAVV
ncbi:NADase-type glycan-binding domain-containing protein [Pseudonocardia yuanmonensis]|uniref:NADase-type glycan-binding domain-containing protein n=1 Tax=Pseudonocardia yuanmonensis TaxID=1095914 RepID=UPI0031F079B7